jgi:hypothetical protein
MKLFMHKGLKTALINMFVDPENGFLKLTLTDEEGGVLYVPGGEEVSPLMGEIIKGSRGSIFVIAQDYHPRTHISFMPNHSGIMGYRIERFKELLKEHGQPIPSDEQELFTRAQQPVHFFNGFDQAPARFPFPEIVLDENRDIIGLKEADGRIREVRVETSSGLDPQKNDRGRVTKVLDSYHSKTFDECRKEGRLISTQTLWTVHCVQGTQSCLYPASMKLPLGLQQKLAGDMASKVIHHRDAATDNEFWVVRKGMDPEIDSYGIGVENDGRTMTPAWEVFAQIAEALKRLGCEQVIINGGGLATNFCVEFSLNNTADFLAGQFKMKGMQVQINFVPEISRGIPIPGGADMPFSLDGTAERLAGRGIGQATVAEIMALSALTTPEKPLYAPLVPVVPEERAPN